MNGTAGADRLAIRDLVEAYALAVDRPDPAAVAALFTDDGELVLHMEAGSDRETGLRRGRGEIERAVSVIAEYDATHHTISSHRADVHGDFASGETRCEAHHVKGDLDRVLFLHYLDSYRRDAGEWRFTRRELHVRWVTTLSASWEG